MSPKFVPSLLSTDSLRGISGGYVADGGAESYDWWLNLLTRLSGDVGETIEATLMPPDAGLFNGCVLGPVEIGEGVLSMMDEASVPGVVAVPQADAVLLSMRGQ
jgi:hypothetical protein